MKKKIIGIIVVIALVVGGIGAYYFTHRGGSVGLSATIKDENHKTAQLKKYKDKKVLVSILVNLVIRRSLRKLFLMK